MNSFISGFLDFLKMLCVFTFIYLIIFNQVDIQRSITDLSESCEKFQE